MHTGRFSKLIPWLFAAPALIALSLFFVYPTIVTIVLSFTRGTITTPAKEYVGLDNYRILLTEDRFFLNWEDGVLSGALVNSFVWLIVFPTAVVLIGLLVAVLADKVKYEAIIKSILFMPMAISATAAAVIFRLLYNQDSNLGSLNAFLRALFPDFQPIAFLGSVEFANLAVIFAGVWISTGLSVVVLSAAYKAVPAEIHEAGRIDGANAWQLFWRVSLPMLSGPVTFIAVTMIINALKMIDLVLVMTKGAPRGATRIIGYTVFWETFNNNRSGYGSAVAVILLILVMPFIIYQVRRVRQEL
ncbi:MAG: sugar ABC transporter permease [Chloroflexota bacterium]|nr:sugar ABC transporter permease [Chloroflexota bacterium]MDE2947970.1 sugar ABC transporter permease [Chloroflexota bacterium]